MLQPGTPAPDFCLNDQNGKSIHLQDFIGKKNIVLYFYPKDETGGCTREACAFRDRYQDFTDAGCEVIGVSADDVNSHRSFAANHQLPFILLADTEKRIHQLYDVQSSFFGLLSGRVTYIIDKKGLIIHAYDSLLGFEKHVKKALETIASMEK